MWGLYGCQIDSTVYLDGGVKVTYDPTMCHWHTVTHTREPFFYVRNKKTLKETPWLMQRKALGSGILWLCFILVDSDWGCTSPQQK